MLLQILRKCYTKLLESNIQELKRRPVYIIAPWWQPPNVNIASSKKSNSSTKPALSSKNSPENFGIHRLKRD